MRTQSSRLKKLITALTIAGISHTTSFAQNCIFNRVSEVDPKLEYSSFRDMRGKEIHVYIDLIAQLFRRTEDGSAVGEMVTSSILEGDDSLILTLRQDCGWSDGTPLTARDYQDGLLALFKPENDHYNPGRGFFQNGTEVLAGDYDISELGIRALDDHTLEIKTDVAKDFFELILTRYNFAPIPTHLTPREMAEWNKGDLKRISSGAYVVYEISENKIKMRRNPYYCEGLRHDVDEAHLTIEGASPEKDVLFIKGEIDYIDEIQLREYDTVTDRMSPESYTMQPENDEVLAFYRVSTDSILTDYPDLRRALAMSIDRTKMTHLAANPEVPSIPVMSLGYPYPKYDPELPDWLKPPLDERRREAQKLFAEAGFHDDNRMRLIILDNVWSDVEAIALTLRSAWSSLPIDFRIIQANNFQEYQAYEEADPEIWDITTLLWGSDYPDPVNFVLGFAISGRNEGLGEQQYQEVMNTFNIKDSRARYDAIEAVDRSMLDDAFFVPLVTKQSLVMFQHGFKSGELFNMSTYNVQNDDCGSGTSATANLKATPSAEN